MICQFRYVTASCKEIAQNSKNEALVFLLAGLMMIVRRGDEVCFLIK